jgi:steroid delta-isomerase-like uncharacterized protein
MTNQELIQLYYKYFNSQNWDGMLSLVADNITHEPNQSEPRFGIDKFKEFLKKMDESYEEKLTDMIFYSEATGQKFACEFVVNGKYKKGEEGLPPAYGQPYVLPASAFLTIENGKITRVATNYNLEKWIELVS